MDAIDSWVAGCEWVLGELVGQVYGEEYSGKYDLAFKIFSLQGCGGGGGGSAENCFSETGKCDTPPTIAPGCVCNYWGDLPPESCHGPFTCQVTTLSSRYFLGKQDQLQN